MANTLQRMLKLAELLNEDKVCDGVCIHINSFIKKMAHYEAINDGTTPNPWRKNMDYSSDENSPYFGSIKEFMKKFPGGIKDWLKWRRETQTDRNKLFNIRKKTKKRVAILDALMKSAEEKFEVGDVVKIKDGSVFGLLQDAVIGIILKKKNVSGRSMYLVDPLDIEKDAKKMGQSSWVPEYILESSSLKEIDKKAHYAPTGGDDVDKFENEPLLYSDEGLDKFKSVKEFIEKRRKEMGQSADDAAYDAVKDFIKYWKILLKKKDK